MKRKNVLFYVVALVMALLMGSCAESKLKVVVAAINSQCPIERGKMVLESVETDDHTVVFNLRARNDLEFAAFEVAPPMMKLFVIGFIEYMKGKSERLVQVFIDADARIRVILKNRAGDKQVVGEYTMQELTLPNITLPTTL